MAEAAVGGIRWREACGWVEQWLGMDESARGSALAGLSRDDPALYPHVVTLVRAQAALERSPFFLGLDVMAEVPPTLGGEPGAGDPALSAGLALGPYRLERPLGAGGMGEVWLARRADGLFEAPVALKLLHDHLAGSSQRSRFVREGRILGQLSHPHVAHLLDAGALPDGRLYLALEFVEGERLDRWCDAQRLGIRERVALFRDVCDAVAHAHARLVVHRDLKPSNILVTGEGSIKLLDFGIAKLIEPEEGSSQATELTHLGGRVLTPEYAAPEQVLGAPVTVATDVYSLGVLLYVLLTGRRPYGAPGATLSQLEQAVVGVEPPPASQARPLSADEPTTAEVALARGLSPDGLRHALRGDLDTVVAKALKKAPGERYASVAALAEDLRRHLALQPLLARRDSLAYRARKFLRRNRLSVLAGFAVAAAVIAGIASTIWQAQRAEQQAIEARDQAQRVRRTKNFFVSVFQEADPLRKQEGAPVTLTTALDRALARVDTELSADPSLQGDLLDDFGEIKAGLGDIAAAKAMFERALPLHEATLPPEDPAIANTLVNLGMIRSYMGQALAGRPYFERAIAILERHADSEGDALANARSGLAQVYMESGETDLALEQVRLGLAYYRQAPGDKERRLGIALGNLGTFLVHAGRGDEAVPYFQECITVIERNFGPRAANLLDCLSGLSAVAADRHRVAEQAAWAERGLEVARANFPSDHPWLARSILGLGLARQAQGREGDAEPLLREALGMYERGEGYAPQRIELEASLASVEEHTGAPDQALAFARQAQAACAALPEPAARAVRACAGIGETVQRLAALPGRGSPAPM